MVRPPRTAPAGFTLIELMIVLVIIGVIAAAIAPSLTSVLADHRQASCAMDLVRLSRRARSLTESSGFAHVLRFRQAETNNSNLGAIQLFAGMNPKCRQTPWALAFDVAAPLPLRALEVFDMAYYNPTDGVTLPTAADTNRQVITLRATVVGTAQQNIQICYQPNGQSYFLAAAAAGAFARQADPVLFTITRAVGGTAHGTPRQVLFPVAGSARAL